MAIDKLTELALRAGKGDEVAMDELLPKVMIIAKRVANRQLWYNSIEDEEDLAQDIMYCFLKSLSSFTAKSKFITWFTRLANNTSVNNHRKAIAKQRQSGKFEDKDFYFPDYDTALYCEQLIRLCTNEQQRVMWLLLNGCSLEQAAKITGIGYDAVKSRQRRATKRIQAKLRYL